MTGPRRLQQHTVQQAQQARAHVNVSATDHGSSYLPNIKTALQAEAEGKRHAAVTTRMRYHTAARHTALQLQPLEGQT
jgi:hypothetical protein